MARRSNQSRSRKSKTVCLDALTPVQRALLAALSSGEPVSRHVLRALLYDPDGSVRNLTPHISALRKILRPLGQDIVCCFHRRGIYYRHVRHLHPVSQDTVTVGSYCEPPAVSTKTV